LEPWPERAEKDGTLRPLIRAGSKVARFPVYVSRIKLTICGFCVKIPKK